MKIELKHHKIPIIQKYKIFTDGQLTHISSRELFSGPAIVHLFRNGSTSPVITMKAKGFMSGLQIVRGNNVMEFRPIADSHDRCQYNGDIYDIYRHTKGKKYSIFKNYIQVAWWGKNAVMWLSRFNYILMADNDSDIDLLIAFCLYFNYYTDDGDGGFLLSWEIDVGKTFDTNWRPK